MRRILKSMVQSLFDRPNSPATADPMSFTLHDAIRLVQKEQYAATQTAVTNNKARATCSGARIHWGHPNSQVVSF